MKLKVKNLSKILIFLALYNLSFAIPEYNKDDEKRLNSVKEFYSNVLRDGKSKTNPTPLFADGINILTNSPVEWIFPNGEKVKISNFANQQNFLRTLVSLTEVTGDQKYKITAINTSKYFMDNFISENKLFYWGGHRFLNLDTLATVGPQNKNQVHELKNLFPYYEFLYQINPEATKNYVIAFWNAHVEDWDTLDMGRHGNYNKKFNPNIFKEHLPKNIVNPRKLPVLPETKGLTFINAGSDLIYSAYILNSLSPDKDMLMWGKTVFTQYQLARNPKTGAPVYQFTSPKRREWPPKNDKDTNSKFGDRAFRQFGAEFGDIAKEANALFKGNPKTIVVDNSLVLYDIYSKTKDPDILNNAVDNLKNYYKIALNQENGSLKPVWNDGTDLTNYTLVRDGYYGKKGSILKSESIKSEEYAIPLIRWYSITKDQDLWNTARIILNKNFDLGDIGTFDGKNILLNMGTTNSSPYSIFLMIDLYKTTNNDKYIELARIVGNNLVTTKFKNGYFVSEPNLLNAKIDSIEAFALVSLDAVLKGKDKNIPQYISHGGYIHGEHIEGESVYDKNVIYGKTINEEIK